jgi:hypothetical protein
MTKKNDEIVPVEVFSGTQGEVDFLISLLENAEVTVYLKDNYAGTIIPYLASPGAASPITIVVSSEDAEKAKQVVDEYLKNGRK